MRKAFVAVAMIGSLSLIGCGSNGDKADTGVTPVVDAGELPDAAVAPGADAAVAGLDASATGVDAGTLTPTACKPITNAGCDAGVCFTTAIDLIGNKTYGCGNPGAGGDYAACTTSLDCQANFSCLALAAETATTCHQYCSGLLSLPCPGAAATPEDCVSYGADLDFGYCVRVPACDLYAQDCQGDGGVGCYPVYGGNGCVNAGAKAVGATCSGNSKECAPGIVCVPASATGNDAGVATCETACNPGAANTCTSPATCKTIAARPYGFCQ